MIKWTSFEYVFGVFLFRFFNQNYNHDTNLWVSTLAHEIVKCEHDANGFYHSIFSTRTHKINKHYFGWLLNFIVLISMHWNVVSKAKQNAKPNRIPT